MANEQPVLADRRDRRCATRAGIFWPAMSSVPRLRADRVALFVAILDGAVRLPL